MVEVRLFPEGTVPEWTTPGWYAGRDSAPHLDQDLHRGRLLTASQHVTDAVRDYGVDTVVDVGAGDGGLLSTLPAVRTFGYDLQQSNVDAARANRGLHVQLRDVVADPIEWPTGTVCAVATEMLEHLLDPHAFVRDIADHAAVIVASSPWTETNGGAYEFHTWAWDLPGYAALIQQGGYRIVRHETVSMFQVVMGVRL